MEKNCINTYMYINDVSSTFLSISYGGCIILSNICDNIKEIIIDGHNPYPHHKNMIIKTIRVIV